MRERLTVFTAFWRYAPNFCVEIDFIPVRAAKFLDAARCQNAEENRFTAFTTHESRYERLDFFERDSFVMLYRLDFAFSG